MNIILDVAAALSAVIWPIVVLLILLAYRKKIPVLVEGLASRVTKLGFAGISLELAVAKPFVPQWSETAGALDLRHKATAMQLNDSTARTFLTQLTEESTADYAVINLGMGEEWLTSRLFIMAIVFARMKGVEGFVFLETLGNSRKRYVGWAEPEKIRWALARRYSWLEQAFADAYSIIISQHIGFIVSDEGRLGYGYSPHDPGLSIELLKEFLQRVQLPQLVGLEDWVLIDTNTNIYEHAEWIDSEKLEQILGDNLNTSTIHSSELRAKNTAEQVKMFLSVPDRFVAVVGDDQRFEYLVDRNVLLEQVARGVAAEPDGRSSN